MPKPQRFSLLVLFLFFALHSSATHPQVSGERDSGSPDVETLNFKEWTVRCVQNQAGGDKNCAMLQRLNLKSGQRLLTVQLRRQTLKQEDGVRANILVFTVPWGVHLKQGVEFNVDDGEPQTIAYERCDPNGCYAGLIVDDSVLSSMLKGSEAKVRFVEPAGRALTVTVSLMGFTAAYRNLP